MEWVKKILTEIELIVDSTEQDIEKSKNDQKKEFYTFKKQIITTEKGKEIVDVLIG